MSTPKITIEISRTAAEKHSNPGKKVSDQMLSDFITDCVVSGLEIMEFPESDIKTIITDE
ncbi:hypothetical protein Xbed_03219 [Xenorhabdus beddingii]|uniref:Uncharacterized protein n=2 Tax=Xenorhabdus beddingii TaxID=40578 RepID=A0A1Y2SHJ0_9GAMM|nr:hypothetical protein [Xenorhabdus beddingii]OTA14482.1 hypothetical protein Xbed_03673 [Xenorhabdus beddingii]OTA18148.1 hypothetical protein Xbed_03219 [Xenorhabdus beddingii]